MPIQQEITGKYFLKKNSILSVNDFSDAFLISGINVYEVIRVIDFVPLFLEEHCERFASSLKGKNIDFNCHRDTIKRKLKMVIKENNLQFGNIKIVYHHDYSDNPFLIIYPTPFIYPLSEDYLNGVDTSFIEEERPDPELKNWRPAFKEKIKALKTERNVFEIILLNKDGIMTEGSQSNLFFIGDKRIFTARKERILAGITRKFVYEICASEGIEIVEKDLYKDDLPGFESAFLSGTSPKILPVRKIDSYSFDVSHIFLHKIRNEYDLIIHQYIADNKKYYH